MVVATLLLMAAVHVGLQMLPLEADRLQLELAFIPARYTGAASRLPGGTLAAWTSFVTHQWVHGDLAHLGVNAVWMLAFGSAVASRIGALRFIALSTFCGIAGAALFLAMQWGALVPMVGASGAISGLMGAAFRLLLPAIDRGDAHLMREAPALLPLEPLLPSLMSRRMLAACGAFLLINFALAFVGPWITDAGGIAWQAHVGGFLAGLVFFGLFDRPRPTLADPWARTR